MREELDNLKNDNETTYDFLKTQINELEENINQYDAETKQVLDSIRH